MLKIRLMRIGAKQKPFYRVVVIDERSKRSGEYIELVGTYNPLTNPKEIKLKKDRIEHWIKQGAQKSDGFLRILGEAPQRPPRKPKKEKQPSAISHQPSDKTEEKPVEETQPEETPTVEAGDTVEIPADVAVDSENQIKSEESETSKPVNQKEQSETPNAAEQTDTPILSDLSENKETKDEGSA